MAKKIEGSRQIRVEEDVANMADRLASLQNPPQTTSRYLSQYLRPLLKRDLGKALERVKKELSGDSMEG